MSYRDAFSSYHPMVNFLYFALVLLFSMCFMHPACLAISLGSAIAYHIWLDGRKAVCYPGMEDEMGGAKMLDVPAVTDGRVITGRAAGAAFDFALALITSLRGQETAAQVAAGIVYRG